MYKTEAITTANRQAWNQVHPIHEQKQHKNLLQLVKDEQYNAFDAILTQNLQKLKLKGKKAVQICCNNGRETISLANFGAARAVGIDISELAIQDARQLSETACTNCEFIASDIYDLETKLTEKFEEFSHDISNLFSHIADKKIPMSYLLVARKET